MKKLLLLLCVFVLSCSENKGEQMLTEYVSKGIKHINLNINDTDFKIISVVKIADIRSSDSLSFVTEYFEKKKLKKINYFKHRIKEDQKSLIEYQQKLENETFKSLKEFYINQIEGAKSDITRNNELIELYNGDCKGTFLESALVKINAFTKKPDSILSTKYIAKYTMTNPLLQIKQSFNKVLYTDANQSSFISEESSN